MSRRPRRNRPPRLDDLPPARPDPAASAPRAGGPSARRRLIDARITGAHQRLGDYRVVAVVGDETACGMEQVVVWAKPSPVVVVLCVREEKIRRQ